MSAVPPVSLPAGNAELTPLAGAGEYIAGEIAVACSGDAPEREQGAHCFHDLLRPVGSAAPVQA